MRSVVRGAAVNARPTDPVRADIGPPVRRKEDLRFLTGRGRDTDDLNLPCLLYAAFLRSPHVHAQIREINVVADALAEFGARHVDMPFTSEKLWRLVGDELAGGQAQSREAAKRWRS